MSGWGALLCWDLIHRQHRLLSQESFTPCNTVLRLFILRPQTQTWPCWRSRKCVAFPTWWLVFEPFDDQPAVFLGSRLLLWLSSTVGYREVEWEGGGRTGDLQVAKCESAPSGSYSGCAVGTVWGEKHTQTPDLKVSCGPTHSQCRSLKEKTTCPVSLSTSPSACWDRLQLCCHNEHTYRKGWSSDTWLCVVYLFHQCFYSTRTLLYSFHMVEVPLFWIISVPDVFLCSPQTVSFASFCVELLFWSPSVQTLFRCVSFTSSSYLVSMSFNLLMWWTARGRRAGPGPTLSWWEQHICENTDRVFQRKTVWQL